MNSEYEKRKAMLDQVKNNNNDSRFKEYDIDSSLFTRILLTLCILFLFILCDESKYEWNGINTQVVYNEIHDNKTIDELNALILKFRSDL